jgi:DNA recombination protein RmuC
LEVDAMEWMAAAGAAAWIVGMLFGWFLARARAKSDAEIRVREAETIAHSERIRGESLEAQRLSLQTQCDDLHERLRAAETGFAETRARAEETQKRFEEERQLLGQAERKLADTFKSLASDTLRQSTGDFLKIAEEKLKAAHDVAAKDFDAREKKIDDLIKPARESLARLDDEIRKMENDRRGIEGQLSEQLRHLGAQTGKLFDALRTPAVRGRWGEIQLKRVVEIAGMVEHCDFFEQEVQTTENGRFRPDLRIQLPGGKNVVVDSKVPLKAYLEAMECADEATRAMKLVEHANQIRTHITQLSSKAYWDACRPAPEFVVLFLPGEMFFSAALQHDAALIEDAAARKVILATPTTLIALLKAVSYGWRSEQLAENAEHISELGQELHERIGTMASYLAKLGGALGKAVEEFNNTARSMETRVLVSTRRFKELGVATKKELDDVDVIETMPRQLLLASNGGAEHV